MIRDPEQDDGDTGGGSAVGSQAETDVSLQARRLALRSILDEDCGPSVVTDGGLSPAARRWLESTPGVDVDDARRWDRTTAEFREVGRRPDLPVRGSAGAEVNRRRMLVVAEARRLLAKYHDLEDRTDRQAPVDRE
jgi:hypothetical protein